jgi:hypothetical protein
VIAGQTRTSGGSVKLPAALPARIQMVGRSIYGRRWRTRLAGGLHISRNTLHRWMAGERPASDIDLDLLSLIAHESNAAARQRMALERLQKAFNRHLRTPSAIDTALNRFGISVVAQIKCLSPRAKMLACITCERPFFSADKRTNRMCRRCKGGDDERI